MVVVGLGGGDHGGGGGGGGGGGVAEISPTVVSEIREAAV